MKSDPEIRSILAQCSMSTRMFAKTMFPERFTRPFPQVTNPIFEAIDDPHIQKIVIAAFRGFGKTSLTNMAFPAKNILYRQKKFIIPISCTASQAELQGENLKRGLRTAPRVKNFFGDIKTDSTVFSKEMWLAKDTLVFPRGAGQQIRGVLAGDDRPDLIVIDDLEDAEAVKSPDRRKQLSDWFEADVVNSVAKGSKKYKIIMIGTVLHEDSLLVNKLQDPDWFHIELPLCDTNYNTFHPDFLTSEEVKKEAESYARKGQLHIFFMEFMNSVIPADAVFQECFFKYYEEDGTMSFDREMENVVICDPAKSTNMASDYSAIVGLGVNLIKHEHEFKARGSFNRIPGIYVRDIINSKLHPEEFFEAALQMCKRMGSRVIGVEVTGLNEYIQYPMESYFKARGFTVEFVWLKSPGGPTNAGMKERRVKGLSPFYRQGLVYHNKTACSPLEHQLISFPRSKHWDVMDATAYVIEMLELGERYIPPDEEMEKKLLAEADDYGDDIVMDNWRCI